MLPGNPGRRTHLLLLFFPHFHLASDLPLELPAANAVFEPPRAPTSNSPMSTEAGHDHPNIPSKEETVPEHQHNHRSYGPSDRRGHDLSGRYSMDHRRRRGDGSPEIATVVESSVVTFTQEQNCNSSSVDCLPPAGPEITSFITTPIAATSTAAPFTIFVSAFALSDCVLSGLGCGPDSTGDISISTPIPSLSTSTPSSQSRYIIPPVLTPISATTTSPSADRTHPVSPSSISLLTPLPTSSSNATTTSSSGDGDGERSIISTTNTQPTFLASRGTSVSSHALNLNHATPISSSGEKAASRSTAPFISPSGILSPTVSLSTPTFTPTTSTSPSSTSSGFIGPHSNPTFPTPLSIPPQSASKLSSWPPGGESTSTTQPSAGSSGVSDSGSSQRESKGHSRSLVIAPPILGVAFIISVLVFVFYFEKRRRAAIVHTTRAMHHDIGEMYYDFGERSRGSAPILICADTYKCSRTRTGSLPPSTAFSRDAPWCAVWIDQPVHSCSESLFRARVGFIRVNDRARISSTGLIPL
ncbi:hypothetical protein OF83DRAFT_423111 [Amylostereum chailletii]|nr:hypothetical protein OF83DRAFT_423111 [Amylostereum chailletii]